MATRKPDHTDRLPGEDEIARLYSEAAGSGPSSALDARILAEARRAGVKRKPFHLRWAVPLSTAAVVVVAVSTVLLMTKEGALNHRTVMDAPSEYSAAPASPPAATSEVPAATPLPLADTHEERQAKEMNRPMRSAAEPAAPAAQLAAPIAESVESKPVRSAPEKLKKAEAPVAAAPAVDRVAEMEPKSLAREDSQRARSTAAAGAAAMKPERADVTAVQASGSPGSYSFNVTVKSPDTGCRQYADWWEVLSEDGKLLYRRVLLHSHVGEQPFTRSGGPVPVQPDTVVWVRAHMNNSGYGGTAMKGSVKASFKPAALDVGFAAGVVRQQPLPDGCAF